jgi:hypothetical protein
VSAEASRGERANVAESLRAAVERTLAVSADTAAGTRTRAQELLDEVARRGLVAREGLAGMRYASARELAAIEARLAALESRLDNLEAAIRARSEQSNPRPHS